jgi:hypothetical protein
MRNGTRKSSKWTAQREKEAICEDGTKESEDQSSDLFELISERSSARRIEGIVLGTVAAISDAGQPLVDFAENPEPDPIVSRSVVEIGIEHIGREVAMMFEDGRPGSPIAIGLMYRPDDTSSLDVRVDQERLVFEAHQEIELLCGASSIVLTRDGKIRIKGTDILTRASGGNRIKGGSVRIN